MGTLKDAAGQQQLMTEVALTAVLRELKTYIDGQSAAADIQALNDRLDALVGAASGDTDKVLDTFNEIKAFLADYSEDDTLKSLIDAVSAQVSTERTRAEGAESALGTRVTAIENVPVMTAAQAEAVFDGVFNPTNP